MSEDIKNNNNEEKKENKILKKFIEILPENVSKKLMSAMDKYMAFRRTTWGEIIETVVVVVIMVIFIRFFIGEIRWIPSGSMHPTLLEGDRIIVERFSRFYAKPKRGDIMIFYPPSTKLSRNPWALFKRLSGLGCKDVAYIKRVVGVPGDKIEIKFEHDGAAYVYVNDKKYDEPYINSKYEYSQCPDNLDELPLFVRASQNFPKCGPFELDEKSYFMMGDNRGNSQDSRYWGTLSEDRFIGRAVLIFFPFNRVQVLHRLKSTNLAE